MFYLSQLHNMALLPYSRGAFKIKEGSANPSSGIDGQEFINNVTNQLLVWYGGTWQLVLSLTPGTPAVSAGNSGIPIGLLLGLTYP